MDSGRLRESRSRAARQAAAQLEVADDRAGLRFEAGTALRVTDMEHEGGAWQQRSTNRTTTHRGKWPGFFDLLCDVDCGRALTSREAEPFDVCWMMAFDKIDSDPGVHVRRHRADREKPIIWLHRRLADTRSLGRLQEWSLSVLADTSCADSCHRATPITRRARCLSNSVSQSSAFATEVTVPAIRWFWTLARLH
ncbi:hypothetical protein [Burkholderia sp. MSMB0856]|uniref:hypothetical protein n=1 Tax=Burkholderia sp. MSMB0856 TaxID=1637869 RepID=UPI001F3C3E31|nr:hypothetical protein [Burkholderia sp. MSMB0856]